MPKSKQVIPIKVAPDRCGVCKYLALAAVGDAVGECRRYPPAPISDEGERVCVSPSMSVSDWCGEFAPRLNS